MIEERIFNGVLHHRPSPDQPWIPYKDVELSARLMETRRFLDMVMEQNRHPMYITGGKPQIEMLQHVPQADQPTLFRFDYEPGDDPGSMRKVLVDEAYCWAPFNPQTNLVEVGELMEFDDELRELETPFVWRKFLLTMHPEQSDEA